jgi:hypothetical protein
MSNITILLVSVGYVSIYFIGFIMGRLNNLSGNMFNNDNNTVKTTSFLNRTKEKQQEIVIDTKKYVTEIKTDQLIKSFADLGNTTVNQDTIAGSVSKLNQLKKG